MEKNENHEENIEHGVDFFKDAEDDVLDGLTAHLEERLSVEGCDHTFGLTRGYLGSIGVEDVGEVLAWLERRGGACDCEALIDVLLMEGRGGRTG